jgi:hypothetical protein
MEMMMSHGRSEMEKRNLLYVKVLKYNKIKQKSKFILNKILNAEHKQNKKKLKITTVKMYPPAKL